MATVISGRAMVEMLRPKGPLEEPDVAYRFSNGREFKRSNPVYATTLTAQEEAELAGGEE